MAHIILFHSVLGLRQIERDLAARWEGEGHTVTLPDLYDGQKTEDYDEGFEIFGGLGSGTMIERASAALAETPRDVVMAGISMGAGLASQLASERPDMSGALLLMGVAPFEDLVEGTPVEVHAAKPDEYDTEEDFAAWRQEHDWPEAVIHRYEGANGHYFIDPTLPAYDAESAELCLERVSTFLKSLDA